MAGPIAQAYLDRLWGLLDQQPLDTELVRGLAQKIREDSGLSEVEQASLLGMIAALGAANLAEERGAA